MLASFRKTRHRRLRANGRRPLLEFLEPRTLLTAWLPQGPAPATGGQVRNIVPDNQVTGAIHTVATHPTDAEVMYIGAVNGGIWKTTNALESHPDWEPLTDDLSLSIGALEFDPTDTSGNTLVAGIGHFSSFGGTGGPLTGVLRTIDGGANWTPLGSEDLAGRNISGVAARGSVILATANRFGGGVHGGVYRSTDFGTTFELVSGTNGLARGAAFDLVADPAEQDRFYVSVAELGIFRSDDQGATWLDISTIQSANGGFFESATSPGNNNTEIAVASNGRLYSGVMIDGQIDYIGYSDDLGSNWTRMDLPLTPESNGTHAGLNPRVKPGGQGAIHFAIAVDPDDPNTIYVGGDRQDGPFPNFVGASGPTARLFRGDATIAPTDTVPSPQWEHLTHRSDISEVPEGGTASNSAPHADSREIAFDSNGDLIEVDDGGVYRRTNPGNNTGDWFSLNGDLAVTEFHDIAYDSNANIIIAGAQDTGTLQQPSPGAITWDSVSTADGGDVAVDDYGTPGMSTRYSSFQELAGFRRRVYDADNNLISTASPPLSVTNGGAPIATQFVTPIALNAVDPSRLVIGGENSVYESHDRGDTVVEAGRGIGVNRNALAYGGQRQGVQNAEVLYVGSGNQVYTRVAASQPLVPTVADFPGDTVRNIVLNPLDWMQAYVVDSNQVFATEDGGASWSDVTGNLVDASLRAIEFITGTTGSLVVGGLSGIWAMALDRPGIWGTLGEALPSAPVFDLDFDESDDVLVAATQGRGAFLLPEASQEAVEVIPQVVVSTPQKPLTTSESGGEVQLQLFLTTQPAEDILVPLSSSNSGEGTVLPSALTFTTENWFLPQEVTVTGVDDDALDGDAGFSLEIGPVLSETGVDPDYHNLAVDSLLIANTDNDQTGFLYWIDHGTGSIVRSARDGSDAVTIVETGANPESAVESTPRYLAVDQENRQLFWTDSTRGQVLRSNLGGSDVHAIVDILGEVRGVAVDSTAGKVYWVDPTNERIQRANFDGSQVEEVVAGELEGARELELDVASGKVYWTNIERGTISRLNFDGSDREFVYRDPGSGPTGLELDTAAGKVYWTDVVDGVIAGADLDGSNATIVQDLKADGPAASGGLAIDRDSGRLYWSDLARGTLQRGATASGFSATLVSGLSLPQGVAITERQPGISAIAPRGVVTDESGGSTDISVTLDTEPIAPVTIDVTTDNPAEATVSVASLTFTPNDWDLPQIVTVTGADDSSGDGDTEYNVRFGRPDSDDTGYASLDEFAVRAVNLDDEIHLRVESFAPTTSGFEITFSSPLAAEHLNLYDSAAGHLGAADVELVGAQVGAITGSLAVDTRSNTVIFVASDGPLAPDTYTVTLRSGELGFQTVEGVPLDGDEDGIAGGNYQTVFDVEAPAAGTVSVGIADIVRGPGQQVSLEPGIPLTISDGFNITRIDFQLAYDPALLRIDLAQVSDAAPEGSTVALTMTLSGATLSFRSIFPLPSGPVTFAQLMGEVPTENANDIYGYKQLLDIHDLTVLTSALDEVPSRDDDGVHVVMFPGDLTGNGRINSADAAATARVGSRLDAGFAGARLADPMIVGDISGNGRLNATDASQVAQSVALLPVENIPEVPPGVVTLPSAFGPDPRLSIARDVVATPGDAITIPVTIDSIVNLQAPNRLFGIDLVIGFDPNVLTPTSVTAGSFMSRFPTWQFVDNIDNVVDVLRVVIFTSAPLAGQFEEELVNLHFTVNANAPDGPISVNLLQNVGDDETALIDENDGFLVLEGPVTNADDDPIDGIVHIASGWTNPLDNLDVDGSTVSSPNDVLVSINELNLRRIIDPDNRLPATRATGQFFYDVDGDDLLTPLDVLAVVNHLNATIGGEGEASSGAGSCNWGVPPQLASCDGGVPPHLLRGDGKLRTVTTGSPTGESSGPKSSLPIVRRFEAAAIPLRALDTRQHDTRELRSVEPGDADVLFGDPREWWNTLASGE